MNVLTDIAFNCDWISAGQDVAELRETAAQFTLRVGDVSLTQNEDVWSKTVRNSVLVSAYPLAIWLAASWWRLNYEPLPKPGVSPSVDWRMVHEIGAANHGYVWPHVVMAPDGEAVQIWAAPSSPGGRQSVRYITGLHTPRSITAECFQGAVDAFIDMVLSRLNALGHSETNLASLWRLVQEDRADPEMARMRRIEAQMGYEPEECPNEVMVEVLKLEARMGAPTLSELTPVFGRRDGGASLDEISRLAGGCGLEGKLQVPATTLDAQSSAEPPWQRGVDAAKDLRLKLGNLRDPIDGDTLYGLLGLKTQTVEEWVPPSRHQVGLAVPTTEGGIKFIPRKRHPTAKRFEFSRLLGDHLNNRGASTCWLASTDLATSRQKFQRAFSAEFLCPIDSLVGFLDMDFSESAVEEAASYFGVSDQTVESLLANNGYIAPRVFKGWLPYSETHRIS